MLTYAIYDKDGQMMFEKETEEDALYNYQQWAQERAAEDGEYYEWQEQVFVIAYDDDGEEVSRCERCAIMDSRKDAYDHGRFDYETSRM